MHGYLFISNGSKPTPEQYASLEQITIGSFSFVAMSAAQELGYRLYYGLNKAHADKVSCTNFDVTFYDQHIYRSIFAFKDNYKAYRNCCIFLEDHPDIEVIHCNTPIGGVIGRLCGHKYGKKVIYTAHGFHFYKGAPLKNWLIYYPVEKILARLTDVMITINHEDYEVASNRFKLHKGGKVYYVPGVGIDTATTVSTNETDRKKMRACLGLKDEDIVCVIVGDLNNNKNVKTLVSALVQCYSNVHYVICGLGPNENKLKKQAIQLGIADRCHFLGYRTDVKEVYCASDMFLFASKREGLPRSTMEAMCTGLPCIVSKIRGNVDLIDEGRGGRLISPEDVDGFTNAINELARKPDLRKKYGEYNKEKIKFFDKDIVKERQIDILKRIFLSRK